MSAEETGAVPREERILSWASVAGSSFMFASVYLLLFLAFRAVTAWVAGRYGLGAVLHLDRIRFLRNELWYPQAVERTFLIGTVFMVVTVVLSYVFYAMYRKGRAFVRLFLIWSLVISSAMVAQRLIGVLFSGYFQFRDLGDMGLELAVYGAYKYYSSAEFMMLALAGFLLTVITGIVVAKPFLQTAWSPPLIGSEITRLNFLYRQLFLPFIIGALLVTALMFPDNLFPNFLGFVTIGIMLVIATMRAMLIGAMQVKRQAVWEKWPLVPTLVFLLTVLFSLTLLKQGIAF
jgi:hypothetical protein